MSPEDARKLATAMGLVMSARASVDAAMRLLVELTDPEEEPAAVEGVCEHPANQRRQIATMGDGPDQEWCGACGERLN